MAKGQKSTVSVILNNNKTTTTSKDVELIVVNSSLVPDNKDINPGVFSS